MPLHPLCPPNNRARVALAEIKSYEAGVLFIPVAGKL